MSDYYTSGSFDWVPEELDCLLHEDILAELPAVEGSAGEETQVTAGL